MSVVESKPHDLDQLSRRDFLKGTIGAVIFASETPMNIGTKELDPRRLGNVDFGFSFSPEQFGLSVNNYKTREGQKTTEKALDALNFFHSELSFNDIRLGIRWNNVVDKNGNLDLGMYKPFLDYCIKNKMNITLNLGIKVFRWPEEHVPEKFLTDSPPKKSEISAKDGIAKTYLGWADNILKELTDTYTEKELGQITTIQPENEPFHSFGEKGWTMDNDYLLSLTAVMQKYFPKAGVLIDSSELNDLDRIYDLFGDLSMFIDKNRLIVGINYYPFASGDVIDPIDSYNLQAIFENKKKLADFEKQGYGIIVSEAQLEPWQSQPLPNGPQNAMNVLIENCLDKIFVLNKETVLSFWGAEYLSMADTSVSKPIFDRLKQLQKIKSGLS